MIRDSIVSGQFYPNTKEELEKFIKAVTPKETSKISAKAIILPHAGYIYSGRVTVTTVNKILAKKRVVILGNNHTGLGAEFGLWKQGSWLTPLGKVDIDSNLAELILKNEGCIKADTSSHIHEHSIEVQLPILKYFFGNFKIVPITCAMATLRKYQEAAKQICSAIKESRKEVLLVATTDLTHYEPDQTARTKDRAAIEAIVNLDEQDLIKKVKSLNITMCGLAPVMTLILCMKELGAKKSQVSLYQTSAEESGDFNSVVGYVGMIIN